MEHAEHDLREYAPYVRERVRRAQAHTRIACVYDPAFPGNLFRLRISLQI